MTPEQYERHLQKRRVMVRQPPAAEHPWWQRTAVAITPGDSKPVTGLDTIRARNPPDRPDRWARPTLTLVIDLHSGLILDGALSWPRPDIQSLALTRGGAPNTRLPGPVTLANQWHRTLANQWRRLGLPEVLNIDGLEFFSFDFCQPIPSPALPTCAITPGAALGWARP